ncbi:hypothetical protein [Pedobacter sp. Leaf176]|uniref:hypothetical protein n=1 Tax=Pedobacter sp. Leaf176 TaxID=1736286 RepID=UPI0006FE1AB3|nr:hypothetical protein [Pedobacter sp. Leaf176]KQR71176.1 hypothetical protein ASF92_07250 [Pedobacter sp. Leaf176]
MKNIKNNTAEKENKKQQERLKSNRNLNEEIIDALIEKNKENTNEKEDKDSTSKSSGFDEWSVSWP